MLLRAIAFLPALLLLAGGCSVMRPAGEHSLNGVYTAREPLSNLTPEDKEARWFHENTLTIHGSRVVLDKAPFYTRLGKTFSSASDGGWYTYKGDVRWNGDQGVIRLKLTMIDGGGVGKTQIALDVIQQADGSLLVRNPEPGVLKSPGGIVYTKETGDRPQ